MTDDEIRDGLIRCNFATPGIWKRGKDCEIYSLHNEALTWVGKLQEVDDVSFVTYARTALPVALKELQELRGRT